MPASHSLLAVSDGSSRPPVHDTTPRLPFDEHLSRRLVALLADVFPHSRQVVAEGLERASDQEVWDHAARHGLVIVTKDADFHQRSFLLGAPPKVVWLRLGNCTTEDVAALIRARAREIRSFAGDDEAAFLELA